MKKFIVSREVDVTTREIQSVEIYAATHADAIRAAEGLPEHEWRVGEMLDYKASQASVYEVEMQEGPKSSCRDLYNEMVRVQGQLQKAQAAAQVAYSEAVKAYEVPPGQEHYDAAMRELETAKFRKAIDEFLGPVEFGSCSEALSRARSRKEKVDVIIEELKRQAGDESK